LSRKEIKKVYEVAEKLRAEKKRVKLAVEAELQSATQAITNRKGTIRDLALILVNDLAKNKLIDACLSKEGVRDELQKRVTAAEAVAEEKKKAAEEKKLAATKDAKAKLIEQKKKSMEQELKLKEQKKKLKEGEKELKERERKLRERERKLIEREACEFSQQFNQQVTKALADDQKKKSMEQELKLKERERKLKEGEKKLKERERKLGERERKMEREACGDCQQFNKQVAKAPTEAEGNGNDILGVDNEGEAENEYMEEDSSDDSEDADTSDSESEASSDSEEYAWEKEKKEVVPSAPSLSEEERKKWPLRGISKPDKHDCIGGRGSKWKDHPGNVKFRQIIDDNDVSYKALSNIEKGALAMTIVQKWRALDPPGRFLKLNEQTKLYDDIGDKEARTKVVKAFATAPPLAVPKLTKISISVVRPSTTTKLGLNFFDFTQDSRAKLSVSEMKEDSLFVGTALKLGMTIETINGVDYMLSKDGLDLLKKAVGQLTIVISPPRLQVGHRVLRDSGSGVLEGPFPIIQVESFGRVTINDGFYMTVCASSIRAVTCKSPSGPIVCLVSSPRHAAEAAAKKDKNGLTKEQRDRANKFFDKQEGRR